MVVKHGGRGAGDVRGYLGVGELARFERPVREQGRINEWGAVHTFRLLVAPLHGVIG